MRLLALLNERFVAGYFKFTLEFNCNDKKSHIFKVESAPQETTILLRASHEIPFINP